MWKGLLTLPFSSSETAAATAELTLGSVGRKNEKEEIAAQVRDRLVLLTYS